jgi:hypothetical protein
MLRRVRKSRWNDRASTWLFKGAMSGLLVLMLLPMMVGTTVSAVAQSIVNLTTEQAKALEESEELLQQVVQLYQQGKYRYCHGSQPACSAVLAGETL